MRLSFKQIGLTVAAVLLSSQLSVYSQTLVGQTLDALPGDIFSYQAKTTPTYGIKWTEDSWAQGAWTAWLSSYHGFKFFTWGSPKMVLSREGNVGIGTEMPVQKLDVAGYILSAQSTNEGGVYLGNVNHGVKRFSGTNDVGLYTTSGKLSLSANGETGRHVVIGTDGNVGIGTTTPGEKLAVNGRILAKEIKVVSGATTSWPDYVFKSTYKLTPLSEVEKFIKTHQHLPEVPSAKEVATNGIEVGANQALLLKKIEELTLYVIEQNKLLLQYQEKLATVEKEVKQLKKK